MRSIKVGNNSGGRDAINRLIKAYKFTSRQQLCDHLSVSKSTMANRYLRDSFPAEWVIQCALETGVSLLWLTTGQGEKNNKLDTNDSFDFVNQGHIKPLADVIAPELDKGTLSDGDLLVRGKITLDSSLIPTGISNPILVYADDSYYLIDLVASQVVVNGMWLVDIDGIKSVAKIVRLPGNRLVIHQCETSFECSFDDIKFLGRALKIIKSI